jgi:Mg-chelatase subunit ChlD
MRQDLTDITLIVDRSGSMESCKSDAQGGINTFITEQQQAEGEATLTLVQFDTEYEFLHRGVPIKDVPEFRLVPRGMTALLDAVGRGVNEAGERLDKLAEEDKPGCVVFVIVTDGHENSSKEFTRDKVRELIKRQTSEYNWQFMFLGADQEAFDEAIAMGVSASAVATYDPKKKSGEAYKAASSNVAQMRYCAMSGKSVSSAFSDEERSAIG